MTLHRFAMQKLVRDKIVDLLQKDGASVTLRPLDDAAFATELQTKLDEEVAELRTAPPAEKLAEYADVLEVIYALAQLDSITPEAIEAERQKKAQSKGGFARRAYIEDISIDDAADAFDYYAKNPDKFRPM